MLWAGQACKEVPVPAPHNARQSPGVGRWKKPGPRAGHGRSFAYASADGLWPGGPPGAHMRDSQSA
eukprot:16421527-Heterocapsa_arctica.AAC.1